MLLYLGIFTIEIKRNKEKSNIENLINLEKYEKNYEQSKYDLMSTYGLLR